MRATLPHTTDFLPRRTADLPPILHAMVGLALAFWLAACDRPPVNRDPARPLTTAQSVDLERYLGRWYEIARFPNGFEKDCVGVTATYSRNTDGTIRVINRCRKHTLDGPEDVAQGVATVVDTQTNAKLSVSFFWPFAGDYWVLDLDPGYRWALVGEPSGRYLWILSRTPAIAPEERSLVVAKLESMGYRTQALYWTPQQP